MSDISPQEALDVDLEPTIDLGARQLKRQALDSLFARAMAGLLPRERQLKNWEPDTLDERHLQAVLLRAGGMPQNKIAAFMGWDESWTSVVLNHPDAKYVLTRIISFAADNVIDLETRIKAHAPEALDAIVEVMRTTQDEKVRSQNAFELLKLAGYGSKPASSGPTINAKNVQINQGVSPAQIDNLASAIRESKQIREVIYELPGSVPGSDGSAAPVIPAESGQYGTGEPPASGSSDTDLENLQLIEREERVA